MKNRNKLFLLNTQFFFHSRPKLPQWLHTIGWRVARAAHCSIALLTKVYEVFNIRNVED